jgi:hypothetical protein
LLDEMLRSGRRVGSREPGLADLGPFDLAAGSSLEACGESAETGLDAAAGRLDRGFETLALEGQGAGSGERAEQAGRDHRSCVDRHLLHVEGDEALRGNFGRRDHLLGIGDAVAWHGLFGHGQRPVGGGDQRRAVGGDETAHDGAAGFHHLGGDQDVDIARGRQPARTPEPGTWAGAISM